MINTYEEAQRKVGHDPQPPDGHYPNNPKLYLDSKHKKQAPQCIRCHQNWPCEYARLEEEFESAKALYQAEIAHLTAKLEEKQ